ncbi:hypothetical protein MMC10_003348 [Thelotrema lepadinum]|nr:hypothetical protein [Thelotrema lepadinum]
MPDQFPFQSSIELTRVAGPIANTIHSICSFEIATALQRSGSDATTEAILTSLLGYRLNDAIIEPFASAVGESKRDRISIYLDILLHSGAGPSVYTALHADRRPMLAMLIQVSLLSFSCEAQGLAFKISKAAESILEEDVKHKYAGPDFGTAPVYATLMRTIIAIRQQTGSFRWNDHYTAVESKLRAGIMVRNGKSKRVKADLSEFLKSRSILERGLSYPILKALLRSIWTIQHWPEQCQLQLRCSTGIATVVVWCHYVLGIDLAVRFRKCEIRFGNAEPKLIIREVRKAEERAVLLNKQDPKEEFFTITPTDSDPPIESERRFAARGFMRNLLLKYVEDNDAIIFGRWLISKALCIHTANFEAAKRRSPQHEVPLPTPSDVMCAGQLLFDENGSDVVQHHEGVLESSTKSLPRPIRRVLENIPLATFLAVLFVFARIRKEEEIDLLPLSTYAFRELKLEKHYCDGDGSIMRIPTLIESFEIMASLLVCRCPPEELSAALLLSNTWGWSVYLNSFDAFDPADLGATYLSVKRGVPTYKGESRLGILDEESGAIYEKGIDAEFVDEESGITFYPGISKSFRDLISIGDQDLKWFRVIRNYKWYTKRRDQYLDYSLGFREMLDLRLQADVLAPCLCDSNSDDESCGASKPAGTKKSTRATDSSNLRLVWPNAEHLQSGLSERVYVRKRLGGVDGNASKNAVANGAWFFDVSESPAARWMQLSDFMSEAVQAMHKPASYVLARQNYCRKCASCLVPTDGNDMVLVLLRGDILSRFE